MMRSLWTSKTGMEAQQTALDAVSHNLANTATTGYKRSHAVFEDLMYQNMRQVGANTTDQTTLPTGLQMGLGVRSVALALFDGVRAGRRLLDEIGALIRQRLGRSPEELPLAKVLEGGTWAAGRRIAAERRPGGGPPLTIISDGTVF